MVRVIITKDLEKEILKVFKKDSVKVFELLFSVKTNPKKGKELAAVGNIVLKELKFKLFRFYFIADKYKIKFLRVGDLQNLLIKFVRMSKKNNQEKVIKEIKNVLRFLYDR